MHHSHKRELRRLRRTTWDECVFLHHGHKRELRLSYRLASVLVGSLHHSHKRELRRQKGKTRGAGLPCTTATSANCDGCARGPSRRGSTVLHHSHKRESRWQICLLCGVHTDYMCAVYTLSSVFAAEYPSGLRTLSRFRASKSPHDPREVYSDFAPSSFSMIRSMPFMARF